jgi:hypothetical protein
MAKASGCFLFVFFLGAACNSDMQLYVPSGGSGQNAPEDKFEVNGALRNACSKGDMGITDEGISSSLYAADSLQQQGLSKQQAESQMELDCTYTCPDLESWNECQSICNDCMSAIVNRIYN